MLHRHRGFASTPIRVILGFYYMYSRVILGLYRDK